MMKKYFCNPSYPIFCNITEDSNCIFSNSLNDSQSITSDTEISSPEELFNIYFYKEDYKSNSNKNKLIK